MRVVFSCEYLLEFLDMRIYGVGGYFSGTPFIIIRVVVEGEVLSYERYVWW